MGQQREETTKNPGRRYGRVISTYPNSRGRTRSQGPGEPGRSREISQASLSSRILRLRLRLNSKRKIILRYRRNAAKRSSSLPEKQIKPESDALKLAFTPATLTGFRELPIGKTFLVFLLWLPRFFIPWVSAWHEFNVYVMSNPWDLKQRQEDLLRVKMYLLAGKCIVCILCSLVVDLLRKKWELDAYVYQFLLIIFTMCPLVGAFIDAVLRSRYFNDEELYRAWWFSSIFLMQGSMSVAFIMFPVQFSCIYRQHLNMSRNAHYNWTSFFVVLEFINAYVAYLIIPGPCPSCEWAQVVGWVEIFVMFLTITMLTLIIMFHIQTFDAIYHLVNFGMQVLRDMFSTKKQEPASEQREQRPYIDAPSEMKMKKLVWFTIIILPVVWSRFSLSVLQSFLPSEDWDDHTFQSPIGFFLFWKIMGVLLMVLVMFGARHRVFPSWTNPVSQKSEIIYLGLPLCLGVLALVVVLGRFATVSHLKEGDVILGPIPNDDKVVIVFINTMFQNWTVCISSKYFAPVKVRPYQMVTREIHDINETNVRVHMEVDPRFEPVILSTKIVRDIKKGEWKILKIQLGDTNVFWNYDNYVYHRTLELYELVDIGDVRPMVGRAQVLIFQWEILPWSSGTYYEMNQSTVSYMVPVNTTLANLVIFTRNRTLNTFRRRRMLWEVPSPGVWTVRLWCLYYLKNDFYYRGGTNCSPCQTPLEFEVDNNSLYLLAEYPYEEKTRQGVIYYPPMYKPRYKWVYWFKSPTSPGSFALYKLAEVAGPSTTRLPNPDELEKDWAVRASLALAGMATGGTHLGFIYLFWVDPPNPRYRTTSLAVCWALVALASKIPNIQTIDVGLKSSIVLLILHILMAGLHIVAAYFMSNPIYNFRLRQD